MSNWKVDSAIDWEILRHQAHTYVARISNLLFLPVPGVSHNQRLAFNIFHTQSPTKFGRSKCVGFWCHSWKISKIYICKYLLMAIEQDYWTTKIWPNYLLSGKYRLPWEDPDIFITPMCKSNGFSWDKQRVLLRQSTPLTFEKPQVSQNCSNLAKKNQPLNLYLRASISHILSGNVK